MSDETIAELARLLAEATRARRLAEAAAMAPPIDEMTARLVQSLRVDVDRARTEAEQRGDELETAQAQIDELRVKLAEAENAVRWPILQRERDNALRERDEARAEVEKLRAEYDAYQTQVANECAPLRRELAEARAEVEALTVDLARVTDELAEARSEARREVDVARAALHAAYEHDAAEVARLRGLLAEAINAWHTEALQGDGIDEAHFSVYQRAYAASRGES